MTAQPPVLKSAAELARLDPVHFPNESSEYRAARAALLAEEIELRRHIERVAAQRRALPPGGAVIGDYRFEAKEERRTLRDCSRANKRSRSTATCSGLSANARARCAPTRSAPGRAMRRTSDSASHWQLSRALRSNVCWGGNRIAAGATSGS
jgi:hypothetical protein